MTGITFSEKLRMPLSRTFAVLMIVLLLFTQTHWKGSPVFRELLFAAGCFLAGIGSLGRLWCSLYISGYKDNTLVMEGPYSMCRNPLYFFSLAGAVGVGLTTQTIFIPLVTAVFFAFYYPGVIQSEEGRLAEIHKENFDAYCRITPCFFPNPRQLKEPEEYMVRPRIFRKNILDNIWFIWLIGILKILESLHEAEIVPVFFKLY